MKIIYMHQYFNTPEMNGGTRSYEMARRMVDAGHDVHMLTSDLRGKSERGGWTEENIDGIKVHWLCVPYNNKMNSYRRIKAFFEFAFKAGRKAISVGGDVIFATSTPLTIAIPAIKAKKHLKVPMVFEVRDLWPELPIAIGALKSPLTKYLAKQLELWAYRNSDSIVALSPEMCEGVINTGYPENKVYNIPNSCDNDLFDVSESVGNDLRRSYEWLEERKLVLYAGTIGQINGLSYLVKIAKEMLEIDHEVRFLVVGDGIEAVKIRALATKFGVLNVNFHMISQIAKKDMPAFFSAATVSTSIFINLKEMWANSANKFFDTLSAGKPIVINYQGWQKDIIDKYDIGVVLDAVDIPLSASVLYQLLTNDEKLTNSAKTSKHLAETMFSRDQLAENLINVIRRVVN